MIKIKPIQVGIALTILISILTFYGAFHFQVWAMNKAHAVSDLPAHTNLIIKFAQENTFPAYSIWYRVVYLVSGLSTSFNKLALTSIALLSSLVAFKYLVTYYIFNKSQHPARIAAISALALILVMPLLSYYSCENKEVGTICITSIHIYLGNIAPNQWHNSTLIFAMPFNLILFYFAIKNIDSNRLQSYVAMSALSVLSILCKPNFVLSFLPILCIGILIMNRDNFRLSIVKCLIVAIPSFILLLYQWYFTFINSNLFSTDARTVIAPFFVWSHYTPHIPISLLLSIAFPLTILLCFSKQLDQFTKFAWFNFIVALSIAIIFAEQPNWGAGNYFWAAIAANYILFTFSLNLLLKQPFNIKSKIAFVFLALHVASGLALLTVFGIGGVFFGKTSLMF